MMLKLNISEDRHRAILATLRSPDSLLEHACLSGLAIEDALPDVSGFANAGIAGCEEAAGDVEKETSLQRRAQQDAEISTHVDLPFTAYIFLRNHCQLLSMSVDNT